METQELLELIEEAGYDTRDYSGRGMSGRSCLGVTCSDPLNLMFDVILSFVQHHDALQQYDAEEITDLLNVLRDARQDNMGYDQFIVYWPSIAWEATPANP